MVRHPGTRPALLPKEHIQPSATAACGSVQRRRDGVFSARKHRASIWWAWTARLQPCTTGCRAYQARSSESLRASSRRMLWPQGSCATSCCKIVRSGRASAKARMSFRLRGERPVISGKSRRRSRANRSLTPVPQPSADCVDADRGVQPRVDACLGVRWKLIRWVLVRKNASRVTINSRMPEVPFSPRSSSIPHSRATRRTAPSETCVFRLSHTTLHGVVAALDANRPSRKFT